MNPSNHFIHQIPNNLMQLQQHSIRSSERTIHHLQQQLLQVNQQNISLKQQLHQITQQRNQLRLIFQKDPLHQIFVEENNLPIYDGVNSFASFDEQERRLSVYHEKLQTYEMKFMLLENRMREKEQLIKHQQSRLMKVQESQFELQRMNKDLSYEVDLLRTGNGELKRMINEYESRRESIAQNYETLRREISNNKQQESYNMRQILNKIQQLTNGWLNVGKVVSGQGREVSEGSERFREMGEKFRQQSVIMEEMGSELDLRNEQIARLLSLQTEATPQYSCDQHTVMQMIKSSQLREQRYKDLLIKHQQMLQTLESSYKQKLHLQQQYIQVKKQFQSTKHLKQENNTLKEQYERYKSSYELMREQVKQSDDNTIVILEENQAFHQMMFVQHGQKLYLSKLEEEVKKYQQRRALRESRELWANVEELVNVNKKLREKVMRAR